MIEKNQTVKVSHKNFFFLPVHSSAIVVEQYQLATDSGGLAFRNQAADWVKKTIAGDSIDLIWKVVTNAETEQLEQSGSRQEQEVEDVLEQYGSKSEASGTLPGEQNPSEAELPSKSELSDIQEDPLIWMKKVQKKGILNLVMDENKISEKETDWSEAWTILREKLEAQINYYFPDETPDPDAVAQVLSDEGLRNLDFTLHGMSLVIHLSADAFYPEHHTLIETTLFYPDIREYMTEKAQIETDNLSYYKTVALTFDDGPTRTNSTKVLNSLMEVGAPATFFMIGKNMKPYADLVQRAHDEGHAVASHNWTHGDARKISAAALRAMPEKVNKALISIIGIPTRYDRVPYGVYPAMIKAKVGWAYIQWSVDTYDWRGRSTSLIMSKTKKQFTDGDIVLMHDIKDNTPNTAKVMAEWLYEQGYILLTVDELFAKDGVTLEPDTVYFRCDDGVTTIKK